MPEVERVIKKEKSHYQSEQWGYLYVKSKPAEASYRVVRDYNQQGWEALANINCTI